MSCLSEYVYSVYIDGELPPDEVRDVETHLVQCERCRRSILALQEEATLLRSVMQEHLPAPALPASGRARGLVLGVGPALAIVVLVAAVAGWLLEQRLPQGISWMNPLSFFGVYEMFFDFVFMARDSAPAVFDLGIAVGATAGVASLLTFLGGAVLRRFVRAGSLGGLALAVAASAPGDARALDLRWGQENVTIEKSETITETLVVSAETLIIDGVVDGDVVGLAERIEIRGTVLGNLLVGGREVVVSGEVHGSAHLFCEDCSVEGDIRSNLYGLAERFEVRDDATIGRDTSLFGEDVRMDGRTARDFFAGARSTELRGSVGRDAFARTDRLRVFADASIGGDLDIQSTRHGTVEIAPGAQISGETIRGTFQHEMPKYENRLTDPGFYMRITVLIVSAFLVGIFLQLLFPRLFAVKLETAGDFARCLGFGFLALIATPVMLLLCFVTIVGIPIGIIGTFVYLTTLFVSVIVTAALVGSAILRAEPESLQEFGLALLIGLLLLAVATNLPFVGGLLGLLVGLTGMGLLVIRAIGFWRSSHGGYA